MTWLNHLRLKITALFCKHKNLYYINGPDTLPTPLSAEEEAECIGSGQYAVQIETEYAFVFNYTVNNERITYNG